MTDTVEIKNIIVRTDRGRQQFTHIGALSESIQKFGLIHPIVVAPTDDPEKFELVVGERRYRGAIMAGLSEIPVTLREGAPASLLAEIELEENICRVDISFEEEGTLLDKIHTLKKKQDYTWSHEKTAEMTNRSVGDVFNKIKLAKKFKERPDMKKACKNLPYTAAVKKVAQIEAAEKVQRMSDQGLIILTTDLQHGDCNELIRKLDNESIDLIVTDPPYGLEKLEALRTTGSDKMSGHQLMSDTHNMTISDVLDILHMLAPQLGRVMKPGAHFYMFCAFQYIGDFIKALSPHLEFQPPILIWDRGKPSGPSYGYNYLSRAEAIVYGYRPPRGRRLNENRYNIFECPDVPRNLRMYPTEKPVPLLQAFIENSSTPNDLVLDPFAGSASTLVAANKSGRRCIGFEIDKESYLRAQLRITDEGLV